MPKMKGNPQSLIDTRPPPEDCFVCWAFIHHRVSDGVALVVFHGYQLASENEMAYRDLLLWAGIQIPQWG